MGVSEPRDHHYNAQVYLKSFAHRGQIVEYDCDQTLATALSYPVVKPVKKVAFERDFYSYKVGDKLDTSTERALSRIENSYRPVVKALKRGKLSRDELTKLAVIAASQEARSPHSRHMMTKPIAQLQEMARLEYRAHNPELTDDEVQARVDKLTRENLMDGEADLTPENISLGNVYHTFKIRLEFFLRMHKCILTSTAQNFITSDHPVTWVDPAVYLGSNGKRSLNSFISLVNEVTFPITRRHCLYMSYMPVVEYGEAQEDVVSVINGRTARHSDRFCYAVPTSKIEERKREIADILNLGLGKPLFHLYAAEPGKADTVILDIARALGLDREDVIRENEALFGSVTEEG